MYAKMLKPLMAIQGFMAVAVVIVSMRQLSVFVGNSILITSFIIGFLLLALAYGCQKGASYMHNLGKALVRNLTIAATFLGIGLSYSFIFIFFNIIEKQASGNNFIAFFAYLGAVLMPLVYHLGKTIPITINLYGQYRPEAKKIELFRYGAIGCFLGAILTSVIFMHFYGVRITILLNSGLLLTAAVLINNEKKSFSKNVVLVLSIIIVIYFFSYQEKRLGILASNEYSDYRIARNLLIDNNRFGTVFSINHSASSFTENNSAKGFSYIEKIKDIIFQQLKVQNKNILVLGAGGFSLSATETFNNRFVYVDIDPNLKKVVETQNIASINGEFVATDARLFLRKNSATFDVIVSDVYSHKTTIPTHLITKEYFDLVAHNLSKNGVAIFNIILNPFLRDKYSVKIDNTIRSAFGFCSTTTMDYASESANVIYLCTPGKTTRASNIYTDDNNQAAMDSVLG